MPVPNRRVPFLLRLLLVVVIALGLTAGLSAAPAEASQKTRMKALISKVLKSSNPKKTYSKLSKSDKALVKKELKSGKVTVHLVPNTTSTAAVPGAGSTSSCWQKTLEADYYGGITRALMFTTTNTTQVCVSGGTVTTVDVPEKFQDVMRLGWHPEGVTDSTLDVNWEGRGVARGAFDFGAAGWVLLSKTLCAQLRLNADMAHYATSSACSVGA